MRLTVGILCSMALAYTVSAQPVFKSLPARGQFRHAVVDPKAKSVFCAVYDRDEVWILDLETGERTAQIRVGKGPVALAFSADYATLACVNRLDNTVSLIRLSETAPYATLETGEGPASIASLSDGRFAVANTFSDTVTLVDPRDAGSTLTLSDAPAVPTAVAASRDYLAVAGRAAPILALFPLDFSKPPAQLLLEDIPFFVTALPKNRFAVATKSALLLIDAEEEKIVGHKSIVVRDLTADGPSLYVLTEQSLLRLGATLEDLEAIALDGPANRLAVRGDVYVAMTPQNKSWQVAIAVLPPELPAVPKSPPAEETVAVEAPETEPAVKMATEEEPKEPERVRWHPFRTAPGRTPRLSPPSASPLNRITRRTIADALAQPTEFGSTEAGFVPPDWTDPARDVAAGKTRFELATGRTVMEDNVHLRLGNMYFRADQFSYSDQTGDYHAQGGVLVEQESSRLTADEVTYVLPGEAEVPPPSFLEPVADEQELAKRRLALGHVDASQVCVIEPTREMTAGHIDYDFAKSAGELTNVRGRAGIYYYSAKKLTLRGPRSFTAEDVWVTTCDREHPHYKLRLKKLSMDEHEALTGTHAWLTFGKIPTPVYLPLWRTGGAEGAPWNFDFKTGRKAELGYYVDTGMRFEITPDIALGPRIFPTEKEGVGLGLDVDYDFMKNPASPLFRTKGEAHGLYTTKDRGFGEWYHRYEYSEDLVARAQVEIWRDQDIYKDFYYERYRHRTMPRDFVNLTYRQPTYVATATTRVNIHPWIYETERLPEATFHLLERRLAEHLYFTFDTVNGYNEREQAGPEAARTANVARLTYDWDPFPAFGVTPFWEAQVNAYSEERMDREPAALFSTMVGTTLQTRFHREYPGFLGFSGFKHLVVPSLTLSYRPESTLSIESIPRFDALDSVAGRARIESKLSNILYGHDLDSKEVWQVARLSLYQGNDLWNELRIAEDYEIEMDVRPRAYWGFQLAGERHIVSDKIQLNAPFGQERAFLEWYERAFDRPWSNAAEYEYHSAFGDYSRVLTQLYYDDTSINGRINGRIGFAYTETSNRVYNREILYGLGYKLGENWGLGFEQVYDIEDGNLRSQSYEIRRGLHCWETALRLRKRESGLDINLEFSIKAFPGTRVRI